VATCKHCGCEMTDPATVTCAGNTVVEYPDGTELPPVPYPVEGRRCHDCNVEGGGFHHPGCDAERCPKCGGQLIGCGCLNKKVYVVIAETAPKPSVGRESVTIVDSVYATETAADARATQVGGWVEEFEVENG